MIDYIDYNVSGVNLNLEQVCDGLYSPLAHLDWTDTWFLLNNVHALSSIKIPTDQFKKIVISYHTEYFQFDDLFELFSKNPDCKFLLLNDGVPETPWPSNVTVVQWISWGQQLDVAIDAHGINDSVFPATKIISSLSNRHEFHKAAVTAFVQKYFSPDQYILSWHDQRLGDMYYLSPGFSIPCEIKDLVLDPKFQNQSPIKFDNDFNKTPVANGNWHHPAYEQCAINLTNESIFNGSSMLNDQLMPLSGPYFTEKTWKPLLAGRAFIPVGHKNSIQSLEALGLKFDWGLDLSFDLITEDFDRMLGIYRCIERLTALTPDAIISRSQHSCEHNLEWIRSGNFRRRCDEENLKKVEKIAEIL